jgi:glycosyltransferase involved in cell wall biosynthesis
MGISDAALGDSPDAPSNEIEEADKLLGANFVDSAYRRLTDLRLRYPDDARVKWLLARCIAVQHDAEAALSFISSDAAADNVPAVSKVVARQAEELLETRLLALQQSGLIDKLAGGLSRLQDINDSLGERMRTLEQIDRSSRAYADAELAMSASPSSARHFNVLYVSGDPASPGHDYRVRNYAEALALHGIPSRQITFGEFDRIAEAIPRSSLVVLWRCPLRADLVPALHLCRLHRVPVVFDVDDYVFEPRIATTRYIDGIRFVQPKDVELYYWGIKAYRRLLLACDATTFTTRYLADRVSELGRPAHVLPNGLDSRYVAAATAAGNARQDGAHVTIGYAPGSKTHQRDFAECASAVAQVLRENPHVRFSIIGPLDLDEWPEFEELRDRIVVDPTIGRDHLRRKLAEVDIHVAPIELNNPFTESKSELKYFEPATMGIPTIASATQPFRSAISDGVTGFVAKTSADWLSALSKLVGDASFRREMGERARTDALASYGPRALGARAKSTYAAIINQYRAGQGLTERCLSICVLFDDDQSLHHRDEPTVACVRGLVDLGHHVRVHFQAAAPTALRRTREIFDLPPTVAVSTGPLAIKPVDVLMATSCATARLAAEHRELAAACCHLITEYELSLFAAGRAAAEARDAYSLGLQHIAHGPFVAEKVAALDGVSPPIVPHFLDHRIFKPLDGVKTEGIRIVVVATPAPASGLNRLAALALEAFRKRADRKVRIDVIGSWTEGETSGYHLHGIPSAHARADLFQRATLGIALTPAAPSPFAVEMMACGLPVVDVAEPGTVSKVGAPSECLVPATLAAMTDAIVSLVGDDRKRRKLADAGLQLAAALPTEYEAADQLNGILRQFVEMVDA